MINVLPDEGRAYARKEYLTRLTALGSFMLGALFLFASLALLPAYLAGAERKGVLEEKLAAAEALVRREMDTSISRDMEQAAVALPLLEQKAAAPRPSAYLGEILAARDGSVALTRMEFTGGSSPVLRILGEARTRDGLIAFFQRLKQLRGAPKVDLPVANLAKSEQMPFLITLSFTQ